MTHLLTCIPSSPALLIEQHCCTSVLLLIITNVMYLLASAAAGIASRQPPAAEQSIFICSLCSQKLSTALRGLVLPTQTGPLFAQMLARNPAILVVHLHCLQQHDQGAGPATIAWWRTISCYFTFYPHSTPSAGKPVQA